ncbi:TRIM32 [Mytilus coruscus]|uniref:TRIM32 n=1 Tax=Mytilus coruscus TaxID=42192 RepID=A0A6J8E4T4_MYTCO|nr:TRIM32 [Mytilus coruscus]
MGILNKTEHDVGDQIKDIRNCCKKLGIKCLSQFTDIQVELVKTFHIEGSDLSCGVCVGDDHIILGNRSSKNILQVFDKKTGHVINTTKFEQDACRLCYDKEQNQIFISPFERKILYKAEIVGDLINHPALLTFNDDYVWASCKHGKHVFIVVDDAFKRFVSTQSPNDSTKMTTVVSTNTDCGTNGMNIVKKTIIFTTKDKEVKCITIQGEDVYCFKDEMIKTPECITALPSGLVLVVDRDSKGSLHVLSEDGNKHKTLLHNFDTITDPRDIWLDNDDHKTFYIAGGEYLQKYRITYD